MKREIILKLINENKSISEIASILGISNNELYRELLELRKKGYHVIGKYYIDGSIFYNFKNRISENSFHLHTQEIETIDLMVISDLHLGSFYETPRLLDKVYDYCINNDIHVILNIGDFVEGDVSINNMKIEPLKQLDHALRVHPSDNSIYNLLLLGNHDYSLLANYNIDLMRGIKERRYDIVPLGYGEEIINIKHDFIVLLHPLKSYEMKTKNYKNALIIRGHGHESKIYQDRNNLILYTPSLSKLNFNNSSNPGAIKLTLFMKNGLIENILVTDLVFINNKINIVKNSIFNVSDNKKIDNEKKLKKV